METVDEMVYYIIRIMTEFARKGSVAWWRGVRGWVVNPGVLNLAKDAIGVMCDSQGIDAEYYSGLAKKYASK